MSAELLAKYPDVDPFLLKKWERIFTAFFDRNAGGEVDWGDFYLVTKKVKDIYGSDSEQMTLARDGLKSLWKGLCELADKNNDKNVSIDEWIQVLCQCLKDKEATWFNEYMTYMFKLFDVSADNELDVAEYADGMDTYGFENHEAHEAFKKFAVDDAGKPIKVDFAKWKEYWREYFYGTDPKARGTYLFGLHGL